MRVILTGSEHTGGLAALRALRAGGFEPRAAVTTSAAHGAASRRAAGVAVVPEPRARPHEFARRLGELADQTGASAVLPGTEAALLALAEHGEAFGPGVAVGAPNAELLARATDKELLPELSARAGLSSPPTILVRAGERPDVALPAVVKPRRSELATDGRLRRFEARMVRTSDELDTAVRALPGGRALVQPHLPGPIVGASGVVWEGRVVASLHQVGHRTWPPGCGIVCFAETVRRDPELERGVDGLMRELRWSGVFNLQFVRSRGRDHLIDINPRLYHSLALAVRAGLNLPTIWTALLLGRVPAVPDYAIGFRFRSEEDFRAVATLVRKRKLGGALTAAIPRRRTAHAVLSLRDPLPALSLVRRSLERGPPRRGRSCR